MLGCVLFQEQCLWVCLFFPQGVCVGVSVVPGTVCVVVSVVPGTMCVGVSVVPVTVCVGVSIVLGQCVWVCLLFWDSVCWYVLSLEQ